MATNVSTAFYDALFGSSVQPSTNLLEQETLNLVKNTLKTPEKFSKLIPPLPAILVELIELLKDEGTDFLDLVSIIEKDPSLAINVLKIANSAKYSFNNEEVLSLKKAVSLLGVSGVASIASTVLIKSIMPDKPIYFKMFGRQIWIHSLQCAHLSEALAAFHHQNEFDAHFLGLIHDVGKIVIFESLCSALGKVLSNEMPGSQTFKELMTELSAEMSYLIAKEWNLPQSYCDALFQLSSKRSSDLSKIVHKANTLSEIYLLFTKNIINEEQVTSLVRKLNVDEALWYNFTLAAETFDMI
jgi:HD-like signal output (HDOD) protein